MSYYTYIVRCANGTLYTGWTTDVEDRVRKHNSGAGAKYTRAHLPVALLACWQFASKSEAMSFEWKIKHLPRDKKLSMIDNHCISLG